ncbi:dinB superfamily protein [Staphylococcus petrasii]|uniref:Bacillithiol transferase BstA n=1 Tax=Staphylococcus petrasii TaxID=1276936 RepID=A0A380G238_9STAP|nr:bacillithiol transferase BstA [Staphylococcus petrasii]PNZ27836.1 damage-inducible protein DinB [Staphylococcus petrasii]TGE12328.1 bacillithiol transferase BstA [Staphylococcus petrasii]TGE17945.1 bacillithiol transferase BstA [Staphylococcus petrasii]SUM45224.1 dinB superfamily protein [Staphylococcus petrasii]
MTNKTIYDVIKTGVNYILSVYDNWNVEEVLDKEDNFFPNTLHWQYGHVLTIFEEALALGNQNVVDVEKYHKLFGYGSSPKDWEGQDVPSIEEIKKDLKTLPERAQKLTDEDLQQELDQPVAGFFKTLDELLVLNAIHVPLHAGKIEEMTRVLKEQ